MPYKNKEDRNIYAKNHYNKNKDRYILRNKKQRNAILDFISNIKSWKSCKDCWNIYPNCAMDFDHLSDKEFNISASARKWFSKEKILKEISKCELVCSNCHRIRTFKRLSEVE